MKISKFRFIAIFLILAFAFIFISNSILDSPPEAMLGSESQAGWQSAISNLLSPIKIVLLGPLLPFIKFLRQDPDAPPPFFLAGFAIYWTILALAIHYLLSRRRLQKQ